MALPAGWVIPANWSPLEQDIFKRLSAGEEIDRRIAPDAKPSAALPEEVSGAFLSECIRKYMDEFPIGIQLYGVKIAGKIDISDTRVTKVIALEHNYIEGPIIATECRFITFSLIGSVVQKYIDMRTASFEGSLFLRNGFRSEASALLRDIRVTGTLDCSRAAFFHNRSNSIDDAFESGHVKGESFSLARSTVGALYWQELSEPPTGIVNLRNCRIGSFRDNMDTEEKLRKDWPPAGGIRIAGLKYEDRTTTDPDALKRWLALQRTTDPEEKTFSAYQAAIKTLRDNGHELEADQLTLAKQRLLAAADTNRANRFFRSAYILLTDAGINTTRILGITIVFFLVTLVFVLALDARGDFAPKSTEVLKDVCYKTPATCTNPDWVDYGDRKLPKYYPPFNPLGYALDLTVPLLATNTAADWRPASNFAIWLTIILRVIGTIFWGLFLFCLTGLARFSR